MADGRRRYGRRRPRNVLGHAIGIRTATSGIDRLEQATQLVIAVIGVALAVDIYSQRGVPRAPDAEPGGRPCWSSRLVLLVFGDLLARSDDPRGPNDLRLIMQGDVPWGLLSCPGPR
jgi:hypothetical protein